jgi:phage shock protein A
MGSLISRTDDDDAGESVPDQIQRQKRLVSDLERRYDHNERVSSACRASAAEALREGDRTVAMFHLRRKRMHESGQDGLQREIMNVHALILKLEQSLLITRAAEGMRGTASALSGAAMDPDVALDIMENLQEQCEAQAEVSDALGATDATGEAAEAAALAELERMCMDTVAAAPAAPMQASAGTGDDPPDEFALPEAPTHPLPVAAAPHVRRGRVCYQAQA